MDRDCEMERIADSSLIPKRCELAGIMHGGCFHILATAMEVAKAHPFLKNKAFQAAAELVFLDARVWLHQAGLPQVFV